MDVYGIITEKIINLLEQGIVPWRRPWTGTGLPRNLVSMKPYRGINYFLLSASKYISPYWLTMRQASQIEPAVSVPAAAHGYFGTPITVAST